MAVGPLHHAIARPEGRASFRTPYRMVPLPRFTGEDTQEPRVSARVIDVPTQASIAVTGARENG